MHEKNFKNDTNPMTTYNEEQKFRQSWIWVILAVPGLLITGMFGVGINRQIIHGQQFGTHPMSNSGLIISFVLVLLLFTVISLQLGFARLTTVIDETGIYFRFFPFQFKFIQINWNMIENCAMVTYNPIRDYGGWGIKYNKSGKAYNVAGDKGLQIQLKSGKKILIGTQKEMELTVFLNKKSHITV